MTTLVDFVLLEAFFISQRERERDDNLFQLHKIPF